MRNTHFSSNGEMGKPELPLAPISRILLLGSFAEFSRERQHQKRGKEHESARALGGQAGVATLRSWVEGPSESLQAMFSYSLSISA